MKNWNLSLNLYIIYFYALIYAVSRAAESENKGFSLNRTLLDVPISKDSYGMLEILPEYLSKFDIPYYILEKDLAAYAQYKQFPIIPCNLCGSRETLQRAQVDTDIHLPGIKVVSL